jgi:hypothetical protein
MLSFLFGFACGVVVSVLYSVLKPLKWKRLQDNVPK